MKILYASCRYDPFDRDAGSGVDFNMYEAFQQNDAELTTVGPFKDRPSLLEKIYRKGHRLFSRKLTAKFSEAYLHYCARIVDETAERVQPDAIFTHNLIPLVYSRSKIPVIPTKLTRSFPTCTNNGLPIPALSITGCWRGRKKRWTAQT